MGVEPCSQLPATLVELLLLIVLMRHHSELEVEEILGLASPELLRLVNFVPYRSHITINGCSNALKAVASVVKVSQHEEKLLS